MAYWLKYWVSLVAQPVFLEKLEEVIHFGVNNFYAKRLICEVCYSLI